MRTVIFSAPLFFLIAMVSLSSRCNNLYANTKKKIETDEYYVNGLKQSKYFMLNGELSKAQLTLDRLKLYKSFLKPIHHRYEAITYFLQSDYEKSLEAIQNIYSLQKGSRLLWRGKICEIEIINMFILDKPINLIQSAWNRCSQMIASLGFEPSIWIQTLLDIRNNRSIGFLNNPLRTLNSEELKSLLKLSLYLDSSHRLVKQLKDLNAGDFQDIILRETVAEVYYRNHKLVEALEVLKGLDTVVALIIRSDIASLQGKYELAYASLKKAFSLKNYSLAILNRIIPLAIMLDQAKELIIYLDQLSKQQGLSITIQSLAAYSYYIQDKSNTASRFLENVELQRNLSFEEIALTAFSLYKSNANKAYEAGYNLCQKKSSFCWLPILDAYQLKRTKNHSVSFTNPLDNFNNLSEDGFLSEQEDIYIDTQLLDQKQQYSDYLINRSQ